MHGRDKNESPVLLIDRMELPPALAYVIGEFNRSSKGIAAIGDDGTVTHISTVPFSISVGYNRIHPFVSLHNGRLRLYALLIGNERANIYSVSHDRADLILAYHRESLEHVPSCNFRPCGQCAMGIAGDIDYMIHLNSSRQLCFMIQHAGYAIVVLVGMDGSFQTKRVNHPHWRSMDDVAHYDPTTDTHYFVYLSLGYVKGSCQIFPIMDGVKLISISRSDPSRVLRSVSIRGNILMFSSSYHNIMYNLASCTKICTWLEIHRVWSLVTENTRICICNGTIDKCDILSIKFTNHTDGTSYNIENCRTPYTRVNVFMT